MRRGRKVGERMIKDITSDEIVSLIVGAAATTEQVS